VTLAAERRQDQRIAAAVALAAVLAFAAALAGEFIYDDIHSIAANPAIRSLANIPRFFCDPDAFSATGNRMYRPVLLCTYALDYALGGDAAWLFKATNVLLHAAAAALLFWLLRGLRVASAAAGAAALLFAVHPLATEAVNLVSARSEQLLVVGVLLALRCQQSARAGSRLAPAGILLGAVIAMGSKETSALLPLLLLVQEWLLGRTPAAAAAAAGRTGRAALLLRLLPAALLTLGYLAARKLLLGQATTNLGDRSGADPLSGAGRDLFTQWATMGTLLPRALLQAVVPTGLGLDPYVTWHHGPDLPVLAGWAAIVWLSWLGLRGGARTPAATFGTVLAWTTALPWVLVPLNVPLSEHRLLGPLAGLMMVLADRLAALPEAAAMLQRRWLRRGLLAGIAVAAVCWSELRSCDYRDERIVWRRVLADQPCNFRAHWGLGLAQLRSGEEREGLHEIATAACLYWKHIDARVHWCEGLLRRPEAETEPFLCLHLADSVLAERPNDPYYRILKASALLQVGTFTGDPERFAAAEAVALSCLDVGRPKGLVFRVAASARAHRGDLEGAIALLDRSVAMGLAHFTVLLDRADLLQQAGRRNDAESDLQRAIGKAPMEPQVRAAVGRFYGAGPR